MMKKVLKALLDNLEINFKDFQWFGYQKGSSPCMDLRGCFISYSAHVKGFVVKISLHDYPPDDFKLGVPRGIQWRRMLPDDITKWIEVSISDEYTRFGRRNILNKEIFPVGTIEYDRISRVFEEIKKIGFFFIPHKSSRLSSEQALIGFLKEIKKTGSP